ncbi:MAG: hypothetical protein LUO80_10995 [Methylococcaceae bacterium]|nr:hypothetical protein [Methylococcaceae bacterium]
MKLLIFSALILILLAGCGATYTKLDPAKAANTATTADADCPNGIDYKTGHCR